MAQARWVAERVQAAAAADGTEVDVELVEVTTHGDVTTQSLSSLGGIGVFTSALRDAVLAGEVDFAVHSLKDLPTAPASGLVLVAVPAREDPRDVLVARDGLGLDQLPAGARVGTGSPRRAAQLRAHRPDLAVVDVRGNVDTRMRLVSEGGMDAVVLARAGLLRLGRQDEATQVFDPETLMPAPGQAALAVECRDSWACAGLRPLLGGIDDLPTRLAVTAERALLAGLEAGCSAPIGALAELVGPVPPDDGDVELSLRAVVAAPDGSNVWRRAATLPLPGTLHRYEGDEPEGPVAAAEALGRALAAQLLADGVEALQPVPAAQAPRVGPLTQTYRQAREGDL
jgi:hydroxymethylbilane synthase